MFRLNGYCRSGIDVPFRHMYVLSEDEFYKAERMLETFFGFRMDSHDHNWRDIKISWKRDTPQDKDNNEVVDKPLRYFLDEDKTWHVIVPFISRGGITRNLFHHEIVKPYARYLGPGIRGENAEDTFKKDGSAEFDKAYPDTKKDVAKDVKKNTFLIFDLDNLDNEPRPIDMVHQDWIRGVDEEGPDVRRPFPYDAYLCDAENTYHQPICSACPRQILHEQGECSVGDPICFVQLKLYKSNTFVSQYRDYEDIKKLCKEDYG